MHNTQIKLNINTQTLQFSLKIRKKNQKTTTCYNWSAAQFVICQMTNRTNVYYHRLLYKHTPRVKQYNNCYAM